MHGVNLNISYSVGVFAIVLISSCILNLLKHHFIYQLAGIAFFFTLTVFRTACIYKADINASPGELYFAVLPMLAGISACLIGMVFGFWFFPPIRKKFKV